MVAAFFLSVIGLTLGLLVFAAADRVGLWANRRFRLPWRRDETGRPMSAVAVDELDALFQPTKRYELDEKRSSLILRDEEDDGAPPRSRVDLDAGTAIIRAPRP
ncbi:MULTISPECIES: DUF6191 domain-containing protein [Thermomonosporaceae]|uniref:DUF6191 domain-containing protein n=1 Tax=Thermomonosporaceae TaxID=2012 RepID=UPI00255ACD3C|nr:MULTISPECIES: DUF6191 domain-containing protein [Thermomonosporaceae]MDL4772923.1 DUF6191 domain-containing protein [Actinomadura xylanilytica]